MEITDLRDTSRVTITDLDEDETSTTFVLTFQDPKTLKYVNSAPISTKAHTRQVRNAIRPFYKDSLNADIVVTGEYFDKDGNIVIKQNDSKVVKRVYTITLDRLIDGLTTSKILVAKTNTKATIKAETPDQVQRSSAPIGGKFKIKCVSPSGEVSYTKDMPQNHHIVWVNQRIMEDCPGFNDKTEILDTRNSKKNTAGRGMWIHFKGLDANPGQFQIVNSEEDPLRGDDFKLEYNTVLPYSTNLFYDPVPYEFLKTFETKPQVTVMVDGLHAACHSMECDYSYIGVDS